MKQWNSVSEILDFAIVNEQQAHDFYDGLAGKMDRPWMSQIFKNFAKEELGHKKKLEDIKAGKKWGPSEKKALDLQIGDYLVADRTRFSDGLSAGFDPGHEKRKKSIQAIH